MAANDIYASNCAGHHKLVASDTRILVASASPPCASAVHSRSAVRRFQNMLRLIDPLVCLVLRACPGTAHQAKLCVSLRDTNCAVVSRSFVPFAAVCAGPDAVLVCPYLLFITRDLKPFACQCVVGCRQRDGKNLGFAKTPTWGIAVADYHIVHIRPMTLVISGPGWNTWRLESLEGRVRQGAGGAARTTNAKRENKGRASSATRSPEHTAPTVPRTVATATKRRLL